MYPLLDPWVESPSFKCKGFTASGHIQENAGIVHCVAIFLFLTQPCLSSQTKLVLFSRLRALRRGCLNDIRTDSQEVAPR